MPRGLIAVADDQAGAIDLSWTPDSDADLAGYYVYRRNTGTALPARRIAPQPTAPTAPAIAAPAFRDTQVERGHTYAYSVSAIDQTGNESAHSHEAVESLPD